MTELSISAYRELLRTSLPQAADANTTEIHTNTLFTAPRHRRALEPDVTVVRGGRGVGKTVWFTTLLSDDLRDLAADEYRLPSLRRIQPLRGFGAERDIDTYPNRNVLAQLLADEVRLKDIWKAVALRAFDHPDIVALPNWKKRIDWVTENEEESERALQKADREATEEGVTKLFLFDALDRLHEDRRSADRLTGSILQFALDLRLETRNLRAKVFIREDMLDSSDKNFPDSSKLESNAVDLTWTQVDLYGLLFQHLGNGEGDTSRDFRSSTGDWREKPDRYVPPDNLTADEKVQREVFARLAGDYMGRNHRRGRTYPWLPNHLADGRGQTSPRSFLVALRTATENTLNNYADHHHPLHWDAIREGVQQASQTRVYEVQEDLPWVAEAISPLSGLQVPIEREEVLHQWSEAELSTTLRNMVEDPTDDAQTRTGPRYPNDHTKLLDELVALGIMTRRLNGKLDLPDVFRLAFDIGRKGGVPRVRT
ncbi:P-loop ATPase, Sll1717 family [Saccharomonospora iraqiensis]|uniref:P-loop ATPase, Sll1717 family n=1 Tax=Saccharomonospora iraqiensis TaxID=52698 RepID=UPI00022E03F7|nr:hypothetical protein [Saccharomonospora iraqiensis]